MRQKTNIGKIGKSGHSPDQNAFTSSMVANSKTFDYLQSKSLTKSDLNKTAIHAKNIDLDVKKFSESPHFGKNGAITNLGIYQNNINKTFYTVNQPKRAGTTLTTYQEEAKRKRAIKKFRNKINVPNSSNSAAMYPKDLKEDIGGNFKLSVKGNEKIFLPINEVLNQARKDQNSNNHTLSDIIKNLSSTRKNKPSLLENINNAIDKGLVDVNRSRGQGMHDLAAIEKSLTNEEITELKKNLNLMSIQKSVMGSANAADKRESRPTQQNNSDLFTSGNLAKKSNSS